MKISRLLSIAALAIMTGQAFASCNTDSDIRLVLTSGGEELAVLDGSDLDGLPQQEFVTSTQWTTGKIEFSGPSLHDVLAHLDVDINETPVTLVAANRYKVEVKPDLITDTTPIVATHINGCRFGLTELGPLWVVFPYDSSVAYRTEAVFATSIWHLIEIRLGP